MRETLCELEEAVALESQAPRPCSLCRLKSSAPAIQARQEQEQQCEHLREELVELCARMSETEAPYHILYFLASRPPWLTGRMQGSERDNRPAGGIS